MFPISPIMWLRIGVVLLILGLGAAVKVQTARLDEEKAAFSAYRGQVEALGQAAEKEAARANLANLKAKEQADRENVKTKRDLAGVYDAYRRMLALQPGGGQVPGTVTFTPSSERSCFDSAKFAAAMGRYEAGILGILEQGDGAIADLDTARVWASSSR